MVYHIDDDQQFILYIKLLATNKMDEIKHDSKISCESDVNNAEIVIVCTKMRSISNKKTTNL